MKLKLVALCLGVLACAALGALSGCLGRPTPPLSLNPAPWADGEMTEYDVLKPDGSLLGTATWTWKRVAEGWEQTFELPLEGRIDRQIVILGADLFPLRSHWASTVTQVTVTYGVEAVTFERREEGGATSTRTISRPVDPLDNSQTLQTQRAMPLVEGYVGRYTNVIPSTGLAVAMTVRVLGAETVTTPAGTFGTWHVVMQAGQSQHDAWYARDAPHQMIKYYNRSAGTQFALRAWREGAHAAWQGSSEPAASELAGVSGPVRPNWAFITLAFLVQYPLMVGMPILVGWRIQRRLQVPWMVFGMGALTFIASQVVHLPLNWALGLLGTGRGVALWPLPALALVAGLSAGVCEEGARWLMLRFGLRRARGWPAALQFGAGHGGVEAIIFGVLAALNLIAMIGLTWLKPAQLGLGPDQASQLQVAVVAYWRSQWYLPVLAGLERVFALAFHVAMAVLVMRAVVRRRIGFLAAAIAAHTALDFWAVWAAASLPILWVEAGVGLSGLAALALIWHLREAPTASDRLSAEV